MFCCSLLYVHSSITIILMGKRELVALLNLSSWCLVIVERLFLAVPWGCLRFVSVVFPDHNHLLFSIHALHHFEGPQNMTQMRSPFMEKGEVCSSFLQKGVKHDNIDNNHSATTAR